MTISPQSDYSRFKWRRSPDDPSLWMRHAAGAEPIHDIWSKCNHGEHTFFLGLKTSVSRPVHLHKLVACARLAWAALRYEVPTIALTTEQDADGNVLMIYRVPKDASEVGDWAQRTVQIAHGCQTLDELRTDRSAKIVPDAFGDQTFIYILYQDDTHYDLLFHTSHVPFDAGGLKIAATQFLRQLALFLSDSGIMLPSDAQWGGETARLLPIIHDILSPGEATSGEPFERTLRGIMSDAAFAFPRQQAFKALGTAPGPTRRVSYTFSKEDSTSILHGSRSHGYTINHIAHAAECRLLALDAIPATSDPGDALFVFQGLVDGRKRLAPPYNLSDGYPGLALIVSPIIVPVSAAVVAAGEDEKAMLLRLAKIVKAEYIKQRSYPSLAAVVMKQCETIMASMRATAAPPAPGAPWFSGDGIGEKYLCPSYIDGYGEACIQIDEHFVSVNRIDPVPFFRLHTWQGRITLSIDANTYAMPVKVQQEFLQKWAELLRLIAWPTADATRN